MGSRVLSFSQEQRERYTARRGLEGPFFYPNGRVTYYDPKEGAYYDPNTDFYLTQEETDLLQADFYAILEKGK